MVDQNVPMGRGLGGSSPPVPCEASLGRLLEGSKASVLVASPVLLIATGPNLYNIVDFE